MFDSFKDMFESITAFVKKMIQSVLDFINAFKPEDPTEPSED